VWVRPEQFLTRLRHRVTLRSVPGYQKGDEAIASRILTQQVRQQIQFETYIVQPSVLRNGRSDALSNLLAAARDYLLQGGLYVFGVIGS